MLKLVLTVSVLVPALPRIEASDRVECTVVGSCWYVLGIWLMIITNYQSQLLKSGNIFIHTEGVMKSIHMFDTLNSNGGGRERGNCMRWRCKNLV